MEGPGWHRRRRCRSLGAVGGIQGTEWEPGAPQADVARRGGPSDMDGVTRFLGLRWDDPQTIRLHIRPDLINRGGMLSGVVTYAMIDYCMGSALWSQTSEAEHIATINIAINYVQTATDGEIVCRARVERRNRTIAVLNGEVRHEDGRLLVSAIGSYSIFPARTRPPALTGARKM